MTISRTEPPLDQPYEGAPWGAAFRRFWKKGFTFTGRASRGEFWRSWVLTNGVITGMYLVFGIARFIDPVRELANFLVIAALLYALAAVIPSLAVSVRRLHDTNQSGAFYFVSLIPLVGGFILLGMLAQPARPEGARFDLPSSAAAPAVPTAPVSSYGEISAPVAASSGPLPPVPPPPSTRIPAATASPVPAAAPAPTVPPVPVPPAPVPPVPVPPPFASAARPFAEPPTTARAVVPVPPAPTFGGAPAAPTAISGIPGIPVPPAVPIPVEDLGSTRIVAPRDASGWTLELPDGRRLSVDGAISLGRDPVSESGGLLVPIDDPARSMSKTHARFDLTETGVTVTDLHSTNGTRIEAPDAPSVSLAPGSATPIPLGGTVVLGEYAVRLQLR